MTRALTLLLLAAVVGCGSKRAAAPSGARASNASSENGSKVRWFGELRAIMHEGRTESQVRIDDIVPGPRAWGVGALEGLRGEITIVDDVAWLALSQPDGTALVRPRERAEAIGAGAALLVVANVAAWDEVSFAEDVRWPELDTHLQQVIEASGRSLDAPLALRIEGPVRALHWHVVDGSKLAPGAGHADHVRTAVSGALDAPQATLVGFFSNQHAGVFTHAGSRSHFHAVIATPLVSGHVDSVDVLRGARLFLAR